MMMSSQNTIYVAEQEPGSEVSYKVESRVREFDSHVSLELTISGSVHKENNDLFSEHEIIIMLPSVGMVYDVVKAIQEAYSTRQFQR